MEQSQVLVQCLVTVVFHVGTVTFTKYVYRNGDRLSIPPLTVNASTTSGVYQCVIYEAVAKLYLAPTNY